LLIEIVKLRGVLMSAEKDDMVVIPLHDNGCTYVPRSEYNAKVRELGSETKARQYFLSKEYPKT
jgi:hypothetical protein